MEGRTFRVIGQQEKVESIRVVSLPQGAAASGKAPVTGINRCAPITASGVTTFTIPPGHVGLLFGAGVTAQWLTRETPEVLTVEGGAPLAVRLGNDSATDLLDVQIEVKGRSTGQVPEAGDLPWSWEASVEGGSCTVPFVAGVYRIRVSDGRRVGTWTGEIEEPREITIALAPGFHAKGLVSGYPTNLEVAGQIELRTVENELHSPIRRISISRSGAWSIDDIGIEVGASYYFRLVHPGSVPNQAVVQAPEPGERIELPLEWTPGTHQSFLAQGLDGKGVPGLRVLMQWSAASGWNRQYATTDRDGVAVFEQCPTTTAYMRTVGVGFSNASQGPFTLPSAGEEPLVLVANRCLDVRGTIGPAELIGDGYTVLYWSDVGFPSEVEFEAGSGGDFLLPGVPYGAVSLSAHSPLGSLTEQVDLEITDGGTPELALTLTGLSRMTARVVDHATGSRVEGARLTGHRLSGAGKRISRWEVPVAQDSSGFFRNFDVPSEGLLLEATAPDMALATKVVLGSIQGDGRVHSIRLKQLQPLTVNLIGADQGASYRYHTSNIHGSSDGPFGAGGSVRFEACEPLSIGRFRVSTPDGSLYQVSQRLGGGSDWVIAVPVDTGRVVMVDLGEVLQAGYTHPFQLRTRYRHPDGQEIIHTRHVGEGASAARCADLPEVACTLMLYSGDEHVASQVVDLTASGDINVSLSPGFSQGKVRLIANPQSTIAQSTLAMSPVGHPGHWLIVNRDDDGNLAMEELGAGDHWLCVAYSGHAPFFFQWFLEPNREGNSVQEVIVKPGCRLIMRANSPADGLIPVPLIVSSIRFPGLELEVMSGTSESPEALPVSPGSYRWRFSVPGYWPESGIVDVSIGDQLVDIALRKIGSVKLLGAPNTEVVIWSVADDHATSEWAQEAPGAGASRFLPSGDLLLELPEGAYTAWGAGTEGAGAVAFEVLAGEQVTVQIE